MISTPDHDETRPLALRARIARWVRGQTFARDITFVLAFKLVLLMALKFTFFNHPQAENMSMPPGDVARAILSVTVPTTPQGDQHAH